MFGCSLQSNKGGKYVVEGAVESRFGTAKITALTCINYASVDFKKFAAGQGKHIPFLPKASLSVLEPSQNSVQ